MKGLISVLAVAFMVGCGPRDDSRNGNWKVWYARKGVLDEAYNYNGDALCGWVEGIKTIRAIEVYDKTEWYSSVSDGNHHLITIAVDDSRAAAEHRVETSIQCK
jgi:hypothetical protein